MSRFFTPLRVAARSTPFVRVSAAVIRPSHSHFHHVAFRCAVDPAAPPAPLQANEVTERVINVVKKFEKVKDPNAVNANVAFAADLGQHTHIMQIRMGMFVSHVRSCLFVCLMCSPPVVVRVCVSLLLFLRFGQFGCC